MKMLLSSCLFLVVARTVLGECGKCSATSNTQCDSLNKFRMCNPVTSVAGGETYTCPAGLWCSSTLANPCGSGNPDCLCNFCINNVACVSDTQYRYCSVPDVILSCSDDTTCSPESPAICVAGAASTCPLSTCSNTGRFPTPGSACKAYYLCSRARNGTLTRTDLSCAGVSLFNPASQKCTTRYTCVV